MEIDTPRWGQIPYPGKPMMASEVGYQSIALSIVPQPKFPYTTFDVQAKYIPRLYLEHFRYERVIEISRA
jgi:hypothetical protein